MHDDLAKARDLLDAGDPQGAARELRGLADDLTAGELAPLVRRLADAVGIEEPSAASLLGLPAGPYRPGTPDTPDTLVVAYDLNGCHGELLDALHERAPGELLYEHATCWTDTPAVSADVSALLVQTVVAPGEPGLTVGPDGRPTGAPADDRPAEVLAEEIRTASAEPDEGDGATPPDPDRTLAEFAARAAATWAVGSRDRIRSSGPVRSSRFA